jgi:O-antigen biosynthesis protein
MRSKRVLRPFLKKQLQRVRHVWGTGTIWIPGEMRHWLQHPLVQARINTKVTGSTGEDRFQYFLRKYLTGRLPVNRALTLGCGSGELERGLSQYNFATQHDAFDLSDHAIQSARQAATSLGLTHISYWVADINTVRVDPSSYDVIFGVSSIHHAERLEHLFQQVRDALRPHGYFFLDEYIGPTKFQWTDEQLRAMNEQLELLPRSLKRSVSEPGKFKTQVIRNTIAYMDEVDPSEAVRSAEIVPLLSRYFQIVEFKGYGGSLLHELLYDITGNFVQENPDAVEHLNRLFKLEDEMIASGRLSHDFGVLVAAKPG